MPQQLNLLGPELWRPPQQGTLRHGLMLLALLLLLALAGTALLQFMVRRTEGDLLRLQEATQAQRARMSADPAGSTAGAGHEAAALDADLQRLRQLDAAQRHLQDVIAGGQAGRVQGHSAVLLALARQADPAVWITGLVLGQDGDGMELRGRMADAGALPAYLRRLQDEPLFQGRQFAQISLQRVDTEGSPAAAGAWTEFVLRTRLDTPAPGAKP